MSARATPPPRSPPQAEAPLRIAHAPLWIFGYGSLVWRPDFAHVERRPARLLGYARRFWQGSTDHRGVPGAPGRVVTLVRHSGAVCLGVAYRVAALDTEPVLEMLEHRERGGYLRVALPLQLEGPREQVREAFTWVANPTNPNYLGPAALDAIAEQVAGSAGPSGENREYVLRLAEALRALGGEDPHVSAVAERLARRDA